MTRDEIDSCLTNEGINLQCKYGKYFININKKTYLRDILLSINLGIKDYIKKSLGIEVDYIESNLLSCDTLGDLVEYLYDKINNETDDEKQSFKNDYKDNKPMWHLFPFWVLEGVVRLFMFGCKKYGKDNWMKGADEPYGAERCFSAMMRHYIQWKNGEEKDQESGEHHIDAMIINLIFMRYCVMKKGGKDE